MMDFSHALTNVLRDTGRHRGKTNKCARHNLNNLNQKLQDQTGFEPKVRTKPHLSTGDGLGANDAWVSMSIAANRKRQQCSAV